MFLFFSETRSKFKHTFSTEVFLGDSSWKNLQVLPAFFNKMPEALFWVKVTTLQLK